MMKDLEETTVPPPAGVIRRTGCGDTLLRLRWPHCIVASAAPPFRAAYWADLDVLTAELGPERVTEESLQRSETQSRLLSALAADGGFFEQVGRNTDYIIPPDEILAVNFVYRVEGQPNLPTPRMVEAMGKVVRER